MQNEQIHLTQQQPAWWLIIAEGQMLVCHGAQPVPFGCLDELPFPELDLTEHIVIGEFDGYPLVLVRMSDANQDMGLGEYKGLRYILGKVPDPLFNLVGRGFQIVNFLDTHRFCGQCGQPMQRIDWELAMKCFQCGHRCYPRVSPCIIVAIRKGKQILLANHVRHNKPGQEIYTTLAGFTEAGETLEQCVEREVYEEAGIKVKNIRYIKSQPWPFPHSLMMGFIADYAEGELTIDTNELNDARWFNFDDLPLLPPHGTIARLLIEKVRQRCL
ncbi:NAD(+) diphosphatase [Motilimonas eburnea]|uniref:NAD(+) diphosphatase n=1 Tax=Motilimonas eburnea TaxID=1737488 RepID=UPI001E325276|nr:NAD(+) diphosphatase [Motilimonas eburnea]